jgi:hypothetical protein
MWYNYYYFTLFNNVKICLNFKILNRSLFLKVIEVAVQNEHLLTECQFKNNYKKCQRCNEAINISNQQENEFHFKAKQW